MDQAALITDDMQIFAVLAAIAATIFTVSRWGPLKGLFGVLPPVVWLYFVPMLFTSAGIIPSSADLYSWMSRYLLPFSLLLLTLSVDLRALMRIGRPALIMLLAGTMSIALGVTLSFFLTRGILPADGWQGMSMLAASWIGGSANMLAMQQNLDADPSIFGSLVVADTIVSYGWLGLVIAASAYQKPLDRFLRADPKALEEVDAVLAKAEANRRVASLADIMLIVGGAAALAITVRGLADGLPPVGDPTIISASTWAVIIIVTLGLILSFTPVQKLQEVGANDFGYLGLYLLLPSIGARADLRAITEAPEYLLAGGMTIAFHAILMLMIARAFRLPAFFIAAGSIANVGGAASAPVAAAAYRPALAPIGALMGVAGYVLGIYVPIMISAILAALAGL